MPEPSNFPATVRAVLSSLPPFLSARDRRIRRALAQAADTLEAGGSEPDALEAVARAYREAS